MPGICIDFTDWELLALVITGALAFILGYLVALARSHNGNGVK